MFEKKKIKEAFLIDAAIPSSHILLGTSKWKLLKKKITALKRRKGNGEDNKCQEVTEL